MSNPESENEEGLLILAELLGVRIEAPGSGWIGSSWWWAWDRRGMWYANGPTKGEFLKRLAAAMKHD